MQARHVAAIKAELEGLKKEAEELGRYSIHMSIVLSVILSLGAITIISRNYLTNYLWVDLAAFAVPLPIALYFRKRIVVLGGFVYAAVLILTLSAAFLFSM